MPHSGSTGEMIRQRTGTAARRFDGFGCLGRRQLLIHIVNFDHRHQGGCRALLVAISDEVPKAFLLVRSTRCSNRYDGMAAFQRRPVYISSSFARSLVLSNSFCSELGDMAAHPQSDRSLALPTIGEQHETELSLESDVDHKIWKPDRHVKMALGVQTFCVVRASRSFPPREES